MRPIQRAPGFEYHSTGKDESLRCEQILISKLAERFGTPLYVYSAQIIRQRVREFQRAFRKVDYKIAYSVKANSNLSILQFLAKIGCGFDVVSGGELQRVLRASRSSAKNVVFSGVGKTVSEMHEALRAGILLFNLESASELEALSACAAKMRKQARIALRVNPDVPAQTHPYISTGLHQHKFGVPISDARELYRKAAESKYLKAAGVSVHIGSQITEFTPFSEALERVAELVRQLRNDGHRIEYVDAGGGLGIDYSGEPKDFGSLLYAYAKAISNPLRNLGVKLVLEPGRSIVGPAGILVTRVIYRKKNGEKKFVIVDAAMNDLIRPSLYQADHQIVPIKLANGFVEESVDIVGPICESGDFFARNRKLQSVAEGDLLAILDAGAYGMALASNYNTRPRAAEVLVDGNKAKHIRKRESVRDLMRTEISALS